MENALVCCALFGLKAALQTESTPSPAQAERGQHVLQVGLLSGEIPLISQVLLSTKNKTKRRSEHENILYQRYRGNDPVL